MMLPTPLAFSLFLTCSLAMAGSQSIQQHVDQSSSYTDGQDRGGLPNKDEGQDRGGLPLMAEGQDRGGGAEIGLAFEAAYAIALNDLRIHHPSLYAEIENQGLAALLKRINIIVVDKPLTVRHRGVDQPCVAVNTRSKSLIEVYDKGWQEIQDPILERALALHEVLSLLGLESTGRYSITSVYLANRGRSIDELDSIILPNNLKYIRPPKRLGRDIQET